MSGTTQLPRFTIFPDTCCLFTPKETQIVSHSFAKLFAELKTKLTIFSLSSNVPTSLELACAR